MKSWKVKHVLPLVPKQLCSCGNLLALAGATDLLVYNPESQEILWQMTHKRHAIYDNHEPVFAGDLLITSYLIDKKEDLAWIFALEPKTGAMIWKEKVPASCLMSRNRTDNYLLATAHHIFHAQRKNGHSWLRDAKTGAVIAEMSGYNIDEMRSNNRFIALYEWHAGNLELLDTEASAPAFSPHETGKWIQDFQMDEKLITVLVLDEENDERSLHLRQYALPKLELVGEFNFPEVLEKPLFLDTQDQRHILIEADDSLQCVDLEKGLLRWSIDVEDMPSFIVTKHGIAVFPFMGESELRSLETGEILQSMEDQGLQYPFLQVGNDVLCEGSWIEIESLKNPDVSERTLWLEWQEDQPVIGEPEAVASFSLMERLGASGPRKAVLAEQLSAAQEKLTSDADWQALFKVMGEVFEVKAIHPDVKEFLLEIKTNGRLSGAIGTKEFDSLMGGFTYDNLWSLGPDNIFFPALLYASEPGGHYFYVHLETSEIMCVHHDDNYDWACNWESLLDQKDYQGFARAMFANPLFTLKAWRKFDSGFGDLDQNDLSSLGEEEPEQFFRLLQKATGWSFAKLYDKMWCHELRVLTYGDDNFELLNELEEG